MIPYEPVIFDDPRVVPVSSAWEPLRFIIKDIITRFKLRRSSALEFGVERGYSTTVLANYFKRVVGVDPFNWDFGDGADRGYEAVANLLKDFPNIILVPTVSDEFMRVNDDRYDLIHIDIGYETHAYETTFPAGEWAVQHSNCILFHDIFSFPTINQVCEELSAKYGFDYYGYYEEIGPAGRLCGLGILNKRKE